jgi:transcriptional regulator with XRE-family HTH domain
MTIHKIFAENLRRECMQYRSIAAVCEGIGINRQQFNKYLAGSTIPNVLTLRRICKYFNINEQSLFIDSRGQAVDPTQEGESGFRLKSTANNPFGFLANAAKNFDFTSELLHEGFYFCYFPTPNTPGMLIRSLIYIKNEGRFTSFVRITIFSTSNSKAKSISRGRHTGTVFSTQTDIFFLGVNRYSPYQPSLMAIEKSSLNQKNCGRGVTLTRSGFGIVSVPTFLVYAEASESIRAMISKIGLVHESDKSIDSTIDEALRRPL